VPVPIFCVLPISTRTEPCRTLSKTACFLSSDSASPMAAICSRRMHVATSFSLASLRPSVVPPRRQTWFQVAAPVTSSSAGWASANSP